MMIHDEEILLFTKELGRLIQDYYSCECEKIKNEIYNDILLLSEVISPK